MPETKCQKAGLCRLRMHLPLSKRKRFVDLRLRQALIGNAVLLLITARLLAGPVEFGMRNVKQALADRSLPNSAVQLRTKIVAGKPECFSITPNLVSGSDERGLMYGLLEAADQIRGAALPIDGGWTAQ